MSKTKAGTPKLAEIPWAADGNALVWDLLTQLEEEKNFKVLFGKKEKTDNTSGERKTTVYKRIAETLVPQHFQLNASVAADRVKNKTDSLIKIYQKHAKRLRRTGGGVGGGDDTREEDTEEFMSFYIPPDGPAKETPPEAVNLWDEIISEWPFFPRFHRILAVRPNVNPIAVTTGMGPSGRKTTYYQAPSPEPDDNGTSSSPSETSNPLSVFLAQHNIPAGASLQDILNAAAAAAATTSTKTMAAAPPSTPNKENVPLVAETANKRAPKQSAFAQSAYTSIKNNVKKRNHKRTMEETLLDISRKNATDMNRRAQEELNMRKRQLLLDEYKQGIWTLDEYRQELTKLDGSERDVKKAREHSPDWDLSGFDKEETPAGSADEELDEDLFR